MVICLFHELLNPKNSTLDSTENSNRVCQIMQLEEDDQLERPFLSILPLQKHDEKSNIDIIYKRNNDIKVLYEQKKSKYYGNIVSLYPKRR